MPLLKQIWRPLLALTLILILIKKGPFEIEQVKFILTNTKIILLGFIVFFFQSLFFSIRWKLFIDLFEKIPLTKVFQLNLVGYFFNYFIPGGVGGDIVKALELSKNRQSAQSSRAQALSTVLSDRIFGLFAMISFSFFFLTVEYVLYSDAYILKFLLLSAALFFTIVLSLLFLPAVLAKISSHLVSRHISSKGSAIFIKLEKLVSSLHFTFITFKNLNIQLKSYLLSFCGQIIVIYFMYVVVQTLGVPPPSFLVFYSLCCFGFVASAIPIFPAGIGVGQAAIYIMFSHLSEDLAKATITAITTVQIFNLFYALIGGLIFSFRTKIKKETKETHI